MMLQEIPALRYSARCTSVDLRERSVKPGTEVHENKLKGVHSGLLEHVSFPCVDFIALSTDETFAFCCLHCLSAMQLPC